MEQYPSIRYIAECHKMLRAPQAEARNSLQAKKRKGKKNQTNQE
jgi:hypothetical protein